MKLKFVLLIIISCYLITSCDNGNDSGKGFPKQNVKTLNSKTHVVNSDSVQPPLGKYVGAFREVNITKGIPSKTYSNRKIALTPKATIASAPYEYKLIGDTFSLPVKTNAKSKTKRIGPPMVVLAKEPKANDINPFNFYFYTTQQGLKNNTITSVIEDVIGNLWLTTYGGGITKYDGKYFSIFRTEQGINNNYVTCSFKDHLGNLWFGSEEGAFKYDGNSFTIHNEETGLINNGVRSIFEDSKKRLWLGTDNGVSCLENNSFTHYGTKQGMLLGGIPGAGVSSICEDKNGNIWFAGMGGIEYFNGKSFFHYGIKQGLKNDFISTLLIAKNGDVWFSTDGVTCFDGKSFKDYTSNEGLSHNAVISMSEDSEGNIWFGAYGSLTKFDGVSFETYGPNEGFGINKYVLSILQDKRGQMWFGTEDGLCVYKGNIFTHFSFNEGLGNESKNLSANIVKSINQDIEGNIWFGLDGNGLFKYDGKSFVNYSKSEGFSYQIESIMRDKNHKMWFSTMVDGVGKVEENSCYYIGEKENPLKVYLVKNIVEDNNGGFWYTGYGGIIHRVGDSIYHYGEKQGLSNSIVKCSTIDKHGYLWLGYDKGGIGKYDGKNFTNYSFPDDSEVRITSILESDNGNIIIGTQDHGIIIYDGSQFLNLTDEDGLANNNISSLVKDQNRNIWIGTALGLSSFSMEKFKAYQSNKNQLVFKNYDYSEGFSGIECSSGAFVDDKNDLWVGTKNYVTKCNLLQSASDSMPPNIQITKIELFNENVPWDKLKNKKDTSLVLSNGIVASNIEFDSLSAHYFLPEKLILPYYLNNLTFTYVGVTSLNAKKLKYTYILEGSDKSWSKLSNENKISYGNLSHGDYTFKVKAINSQGHWSKEFLYKFSVLPPWWKTVWFRTIVTLLVICCIWIYIKWRERSLREKQKVLEIKIHEATFEIKEQKHVIEEKHKEITDSINYAERIQRSFLATKELLDSNLKDYFVFFKPKDVVSGDFYWAGKLNNGNFALVTADSTGHGVPGAIMSLLNITSIERAIEDKHEPSEILNETRRIIIERLKKDGSAEGGKDGMDCSLVCFDFKNNSFTYSAANNPVWVVRNKQIFEYAPDKMPVGKHDKDSVSFSQTLVTLEKNDVVYTLTDGMPDQFGGPKGKKYMYKKLKELLIEISDLPMSQQNELIGKNFDQWKGNLEQVDDVTIIGVKI